MASTRGGGGYISRRRYVVEDDRRILGQVDTGGDLGGGLGFKGAKTLARKKESGRNKGRRSAGSSH